MEEKSVETVVVEIYGQRSTDSAVRVCHYAMLRGMRGGSKFHQILGGLGDDKVHTNHVHRRRCH